MAKGFELGLLRWSGDDVRLSYWDSLRGKDVHFILKPDGTSLQTRFVEGDDEEFEEVTEPVNLVIALRSLLADLETAENEEEST